MRRGVFTKTGLTFGRQIVKSVLTKGLRHGCRNRFVLLRAARSWAYSRGRIVFDSTEPKVTGSNPVGCSVASSSLS